MELFPIRSDNGKVTQLLKKKKRFRIPYVTQLKFLDDLQPEADPVEQLITQKLCVHLITILLK
jgi:hypothetical protein